VARKKVSHDDDFSHAENNVEGSSMATSHPSGFSAVERLPSAIACCSSA
jgi:hypothetical protein